MQCHFKVANKQICNRWKDGFSGSLSCHQASVGLLDIPGAGQHFLNSLCIYVMCTILCTLCSVQSVIWLFWTICSVHYSLSSTIALCTLFCSLCLVQSLCTLFCKLVTVHSILYSTLHFLFCAFCSEYPVLYTQYWALSSVGCINFIISMTSKFLTCFSSCFHILASYFYRPTLIDALYRCTFVRFYLALSRATRLL